MRLPRRIGLINISTMPVQLHYMALSAPCRTVMLTAAAIDLPLELHTVDMQAGAHLKPEYLKINPQHTIPTIVDGDLSLWESRTIARYLVNKYAPNSSLYPQEPRKRALVDQRLDFDLGTLYAKFADYFYPIVLKNEPGDETLLKKLQDALGFLNTFLEGQKYAAGEELTIADLSLVATVSTIDAAGISLQDHPNIQKWFELIKRTAPQYEEANQKGIDQYLQLLEEYKKKNKA